MVWLKMPKGMLMVLKVNMPDNFGQPFALLKVDRLLKRLFDHSYKPNTMSHNNEIEALTKSIEDYVVTNYELVKLEATETSSVIASGLVSGFLLVITGILVLFFISLWLGFYISYRMGDSYSGFTIVAGFYLLTGLVLYVSRKKLIEQRIRDNMIRKMFNKN